MENTFENIHYKTVNYLLNAENGYYEKEPELVPFTKLPKDLKVEESRKEFLVNQGANHVIHGRVKNGQYSFFTGLIPPPNTENAFFGNSKEMYHGREKFNLIVFVFSTDNTTLSIYFFNHFYIVNRQERIEFVTRFVNSLNH